MPETACTSERPSIALASRLHMRYDRIIRAYKRDLVCYEQVRT